MRSLEYFNEIADRWDNIRTEDDVRRLASILAQLDIRQGAAVLDVGSGTGIALPLLVDRVGKEGRIVALDFAEEMIIRARAKGYGDNIEYHVADAQDMPLPDASFDWVVCNAVLPHFPDKSRALTEIARVLKRGGGLVICHTKSREAVNQMHVTIGGAIADHLIPDSSTVRTLLSRAGFTKIGIDDAVDRYVATATRR